MRKLFIGTILVSLLGAAVIGAALAWTSQAVSTGQTATAGEASAEVWNVIGTGALVVPTGNWIKVADGGLYNDGDIPVSAVSGSVNNAYVTGVGTCGLVGLVEITNGGKVSVGATASPLYNVFLAMPTNASDLCQNGAITYDLTVNVSSE
jgi:hypothetical protein